MARIVDRTTHHAWCPLISLLPEPPRPRKVAYRSFLCTSQFARVAKDRRKSKTKALTIELLLEPSKNPTIGVFSHPLFAHWLEHLVKFIIKNYKNSIAKISKLSQACKIFETA